MHYVYQTKFGELDGNCLASCLASIFEVPLDEVEEFCHITDNNWAERVDAFVSQYGYAALFIPMCRYLGVPQIGKAHIVGRRTQAIDVLFPGMADCYYILGGHGPRKLGHAVVYKGEQMTHDPSPEGGGVEIPEEIIVFVKRGELAREPADD